MKKTPELEKLANEFLNDGQQESWEKGELGRDAKHMKVVSKEETQKFIDAKESYATSIRLPKELVNNLKILAKKDGLNYQTYLKMILTRHVHENCKRTKDSA
jgi:predicted DNA binding CopG/RHH family protein